MKRRRWLAVVLDAFTVLVYAVFLVFGIGAAATGDASGWVVAALGGVGITLRVAAFVLNRKLARQRAAVASGVLNP